jgi:tRNA (adenine37-N6)-methyltransferase
VVTFSVRPVGWVRAGRDDPANTDHWGDVESTIVLEERFGDECLAGLADFSHVDVVFVFDRTSERDDYREPRSSRGRDDLPRVGVFCDRGPRRPNRLGVTSCRIRAVDGRELRVQGLDAVVGTPVLDVKPVMREFLARDVRQPAWVGALMGEYFQP